MSGPAVHHIVANKVAAQLAQELDPSFMDEVINGKFNAHLNLGSQGPDWFFFLSKDWDPTVNSLVKAYLEIDHFLEKLKADIIALIPPELLQAVEDLKQAVDDVEKRSSAITVIKNLSQKAKDSLALMQADLFKFLEKYVTDGFNIFDLVTTAYHDVPNLKDWWWFDTLHYRKSGEYAKALLKNAQMNTGAFAFAMGYATHYATDTVGHPFVNLVVGGPYRTHSQRHKFVENHQDVWAWKKYMDDEFVLSSLGEDHYKLGGDEDFLPDDVRELILKSLKDIYFKNDKWLYGKEITGDDLDNAYQLWLGYFKRATQITNLPEPVPYSFTEDAEKIFEQFKSNVTDIAEAITNPGNGSWSLLNILEEIALAILSPVLLAAAAIDFILGEIENLAAAPLNYLLSYIYENLYASFKQLQYGLSLNGLAFPFNDQIESDISKHTINNAFPDKNGNIARNFLSVYPMKKFKLPGFFSSSHLIYPFQSPGNIKENDNSNAAPHSYLGQSADFYIDGPLEFSQPFFDLSNEFYPDITDTKIRSEKFGELMKTSTAMSLGNAVDLSLKYVRDFMKNGQDAIFPNYNLDSDRGYGFKGWRRVADQSQLEDPDFSHDLIDIPDTGIFPLKTRTEDKEMPNILTDIIQPHSKVL